MNAVTARRKKQPTADVIREQLVLAADEIIRLRGVIDAICRMHRWKEYHGHSVEESPAPWYRRMFRRRA